MRKYFWVIIFVLCAIVLALLILQKHFPVSTQQAVGTLPSLATSTPTQAASTIPVAKKLSDAAIKNGTYILSPNPVEDGTPLKPLTFADGYWKGEAGSGYTIRQIAYGDLNNDGWDDAVIILWYNSGGSLWFMNLSVILNNKGALDFRDTNFVSPTAIDSLSIVNGVVTASFAGACKNDQGQELGTSRCPAESLSHTVKKFRWENSELVQI